MNAEINNKNKIAVRNIELKDIDLLLELERKIFPDDPWSYDAFLNLTEGKGWGGFIAEDESGIVGYACYYISASEGHLTNIAVVPEFRRKSVAKLLLDNILMVVRENRCEFLLLEVRPSNESAISFYEKYEFKFLYQRPRYYHNPVEDALVMVHYLEYDGEV